MNKILLQAEGLLILVLSTYFYFYLEFSWVVFVIFLLAPDLSALGYLKNNKIGSIWYNVFHTYSIPAAIILFGVLVHSPISLMIGFIWAAHIGMDRMVGYGLKYPTNFQDNHLRRI